MHNITHEQRRVFLQQAGAMLGISVCAASMVSLLSSCEKDESKIVAQGGTVELSLATYSDLKNVGGAIKITVPPYNQGKPVIITRYSPTSFLAVSALCNHQGCEVSLPLNQGGPITCYYENNKCGHGAEFSFSTGEQTKGPGGSTPTGGLTVIPSTFNPTTNIITLTF
jgi:nitrite reductase/ring-hydroxylating ferredoxin subunit